VADALAARGVVVKPGRGEESGLQGLVIRADGSATGAADPRREGVWKTLSEGTDTSGQ
jgi:gamma-glutamyltranspeptidase/glutathione hydrolase